MPAIIGQLLPECLSRYVQVPGLEICSDYGNLIQKVKGDYDLRHPDPTQVDKWLRKHPPARVYGRYVPD